MAVTTKTPRLIVIEPGLINLADQDFLLKEDSICGDQDIQTAVFASLECVKHQGSIARASDATIYLGAFEFKK